MGLDHKIDRRKLLLGTLGSVAGSSVLLCPKDAFAQASSGRDDDPHFLLILFVSGGIDASYIWDARPLSHAKAKLQTNYFKSPVEPTVWEGVNGGKTLVTHLMNPMKKFRQNFSILNGVLMADNFDGHEQNINLTFTGNAFGGDWFAPFMNNAQKFSLDGVSLLGNVFADFPSNGHATISISQSGLRSLATPSVENAESTRQDPMMAFAASRAKAINAASKSPNGRFTQGAGHMLRGILESSNLKNRISRVKVSDAKGLTGIVESAMQIFSAGLSKTVAIDLARLDDFQNQNFGFDVHGADGAKTVPENYQILMNKVAEVFQILQETRFPGSQKSYLDVTTVLMTSDFNRTTRQLNSPIDQSGTDHNPLSNTFLLGGKGIKGNMVVGATDLDTLGGETYANVSAAHKSLDPDLIKAMGKPFDLKEAKVMSGVPETYRRTDYLTVETVINTVLKSFGVTKKEHLRPYAGDRSGTIAPSLDKILT